MGVCITMLMRAFMLVRHRLGRGGLGMVMPSHAEKHGRGSKPLHWYGKGKQPHESDAQGLEHFASVSEAISGGKWPLHGGSRGKNLRWLCQPSAFVNLPPMGMSSAFMATEPWSGRQYLRRLTLPSWEGSESPHLVHFMEYSMIAFQVDDMTCGHCVGSITKAARSVDPNAQVAADLAAKRVEIRSVIANAAQFKAAIEEAGYTPVEADAAGGIATAKGACCGGCH